MERIMTDATNDAVQMQEPVTPELPQTLTLVGKQLKQVKTQILNTSFQVYQTMLQFINGLPKSEVVEEDVMEATEYFNLGFLKLQQAILLLPSITVPVQQVPQPEAATQSDVEATIEPTSQEPAPQVETPLDAA